MKYCIEQVITKALDGLLEIRENEKENEKAYAAQLNKTAYHCGNAHF